MLDRIHKIAEIVAAFAIVGSLLFVGIQMQQNTEALETGLEQNASHRWQEINLTQIAAPGILEAWRASSRIVIGIIQLDIAGIKAVSFQHLESRRTRAGDPVADIE